MILCWLRRWFSSNLLTSRTPRKEGLTSSQRPPISRRKSREALSKNLLMHFHRVCSGSESGPSWGAGVMMGLCRKEQYGLGPHSRVTLAEDGT